MRSVPVNFAALQMLQSAAQVRPMAEASPAAAHLFIVPRLVGAPLRKLFSTHPPMEERGARLDALERVGS